MGAMMKLNLRSWNTSWGKVAGVSFRGGRDHNEDRIAVSDDGEVWLLADGMGGHANGAEAATVAVRSAMQAVPAERSVQAAFEAARRGVVGMRQSEGGRTPGTALVGLSVKPLGGPGSGCEIPFGWIGDSRAWQQSGNGGQLTALTDDHSIGHVVLRCLGGVEKTSEGDLGPEFGTALALPGDVFMLSSDGLHGFVSSAQIRGVLASVDEPAEMARRLVKLAMDEVTTDNVSVIVGRFGG